MIFLQQKRYIFGSERSDWVNPFPLPKRTDWLSPSCSYHPRQIYRLSINLMNHWVNSITCFITCVNLTNLWIHFIICSITCVNLTNIWIYSITCLIICVNLMNLSIHSITCLIICVNLINLWTNSITCTIILLSLINLQSKSSSVKITSITCPCRKSLCGFLSVILKLYSLPQDLSYFCSVHTLFPL